MSYPEDGACVGMPVEMFVPDLEDDGPELFELKIAAAKSVCITCPFQVECRSDAQSRPYTVGVWGGELFTLPEETAEEK